MKKLTFGLIGNGYISQRHKYAIEKIGGKIVNTYDPLLSNLQKIENLFMYDFDYCIICSPSHKHHEHIKMALNDNRIVIVEKPAWLPWNYPIDDNRINIVLQYRYLKDELKKPTNTVKIRMVRDEKYFKTYKADSKLTGGIFYNLLIHGVDLADQLGCDFEGGVFTEGKQERMVDDFNLDSIDMNELYLKMYKKIIFDDEGIKPKDIEFLHWKLYNHSNFYGYGKEALNKTIRIDKDF